MVSSPFAEVPLAPKDPILGITEQYNADPRPTKVNLGVGVYYDENGKLPLLDSVRLAEDALTAKHGARGYLPIDGINLYNKAVQSLLFGADSTLIAEGRLLTVQALGGTGALRIGADLLKRFAPERAGLHQRPQLGKPPRAVRGSRLCSAAISLLRPCHPWGQVRGNAAGASRLQPTGRSSFCMPAATTPPAST